MPLGNEIEIIFRCHFQLSGLWVVPFLFLKLIISFLHFAFRAVPFACLNSFSHPVNTSASLQISTYPNNAGAAVTVLVFGEDASEKSPSTENKSTKIEIWSEPRLNDGNRSIQFGIQPSRAVGMEYTCNFDFHCPFKFHQKPMKRLLCAFCCASVGARRKPTRNSRWLQFASAASVTVERLLRVCSLWAGNS